MVTGTVYLRKTWHKYPGGLLVKSFWRKLPKHILKNFLVRKNQNTNFRFPIFHVLILWRMLNFGILLKKFRNMTCL